MIVRDLNSLHHAQKPQPDSKKGQLLSKKLLMPDVNKKKAISEWLKPEIDKINAQSKIDF